MGVARIYSDFEVFYSIGPSVSTSIRYSVTPFNFIQSAATPTDYSIHLSCQEDRKTIGFVAYYNVLLDYKL